MFSGPGTYDAKFPRDKKGNLMISKDRRFKDIKSDVPGPGTYEVCIPPRRVQPYWFLVWLLSYNFKVKDYNFYI